MSTPTETQPQPASGGGVPPTGTATAGTGEGPVDPARALPRRTLRNVVLTWLGTRTLILLLVNEIIPYAAWKSAITDVVIYHEWTRYLFDGTFPVHDVRWQYPPGAALPMLLPGLVADSRPAYLGVFFVLVGCFDVLAMVLLGRAVRRGAPVRALWLWTIGVPLLGPLSYGRLDLPLAVLVMAALLLAGRPVVQGVLIGLGTLVKVWPIGLLAGFRRWREALVAGAAALATVVVGWTALASALTGADSFLKYQSARGIQMESIAATPFVLARSFGWSGMDGDRYGAREVYGPGVATAVTVCLVATLLAGAFVLVWWLRARWTTATAADAALFVVLVLMVTNKVLSPQYLLWVLGIAAVCTLNRQTSQRPVITLLMWTIAVTHLEFPTLWDAVMFKEWHGLLALTARNVMLVTAMVWSGIRLWRATVGSVVTTESPVRT